MKQVVNPTIDGDKRELRVLAGIEAELEREDNVVFQPRIYLIDYDGQEALYFCYRKGQKYGRKGGYGMFIPEEDLEGFRNPIDVKEPDKLKEFLQKIIDSIPPEQ